MELTMAQGSREQAFVRLNWELVTGLAEAR
jgi:hypothetical protein